MLDIPFIPTYTYCERLGNGSVAEPLNLVSNLAFFVVAIALFVKCKRYGDIRLLALSLLIFAIGLGSALFHHHATKLTQLADGVPIQLFVAAYIVLACKMVLRSNNTTAFGSLALLIISGLAANNFLPFVLPNNSNAYLPMLVALVVFSCASRQISMQAYRCFVLGSIVFTLALVFRTLDLRFCDHWPYGTHFIWHILIAFDAYILVNILVPFLTQRGEKKMRNVLAQPE